MPTKSIIQSMDEALEGFVMVELVITGTIFAIGGGLFYLMLKGIWDKDRDDVSKDSWKKTILLCFGSAGFFMWGVQRFFKIHFWQTRDSKYM